jgi:hypothetical protein
MIKLADILLEIEKPDIDFSALANIDNIVGDELKNAQKKEQPVNEIVGLTAGAFLLALPGMVNGIFRIIKAIKDKAPPKYNLSKPGDNQSHIDFIISFTDKMDGYLDTPFRVMLTPFIEDEIKRDKVAKLIKAIALIIMSLGTDITKSPDIMAVGKKLAGDNWADLANSKKTADLITKVKPMIKSLFT